MRVTSYTFFVFFVAYKESEDTQNTNQIFYEYFASSLYLPDLLMVISFAILSWLLFVIFQLSSMNKEDFGRIHTRIKFINYPFNII